MSNRLKGFLVFSFALVILLYGMILRRSPTSASEAAIGVQTSVYLKDDIFYLFYVLLQVPFGYLLDRYPLRKVYFWVIIISSLGAIIPAFSNALIGLGYFLVVAPLSAAFIATLVTASRWFTHRFFAIAIGFAQLISAIAILIGKQPFVAIINQRGLESVMVTSGIIGVVLAVLSLIIFRDNSIEKLPPFDGGHYKQELRTFLKSSQSWWIGLYTFFGWGTVVVFGGKWGIPFLEAKFNFSPMEMNNILAMFWFGFALLSPLFGWISEVIDNRLSILRIAPALGLLCALTLLYFPIISHSNVALLFFGVGVVGASQLLCFALMKDRYSLRIVGFFLGFVNLCVTGGRQVFQPLVSLYFKAIGAGSTPTVDQMKVGLVVIPIFFAISLIISLFFIKETHCLQSSENI